MKRAPVLLLGGLLVGALLAGCGRAAARADPIAAPVPVPSPVLAGPLVSAGRAVEGQIASAAQRGWVALPAAYGYVNRTRNDCAQAAVASVLTSTGTWQRPDRGGADRQAALMAASPPDIAGGVWGSSPRLVRTMLGSSQDVRGLDAVRSALREGRPALVMLDLGPLERGRGAHWTMVVGVGEEHVQVSNLGGGLVRRDAFERAWSGLIPRLAGVAGTAIVPA